MKRRIKSIALTSENSGVSRLLLAFAVMLITLFAWTLAQAAPVDGVKGHDAAYRLQPANITIKTLPIDSLTDREAASVRRPDGHALVRIVSAPDSHPRDQLASVPDSELVLAAIEDQRHDQIFLVIEMPLQAFEQQPRRIGISVGSTFERVRIGREAPQQSVRG